MDPQQLKEALISDLRTIKFLNPEIIPARTYYGGIFKGVLSGVWKMFLILCFTFIYQEINDSKTSLSWFELIYESSMASLCLSIVPILVFLNPISFYVQFRFHLEKKLKIGALVVKKCRLIARVFFGVFALLCTLFGSYASAQQILLLLVFAYFLSLGAAHIVANMELNRIGLSSLLGLFKKFFSKEKALSLKDLQDKAVDDN
jgi:hypothetical protein